MEEYGDTDPIDDVSNVGYYVSMPASPISSTTSF